MALKSGKKPSALILSVTFSGSGPVRLGATDTVVLVGPNNSGKSMSLREIEAIASRGREERTMAITDMELEKTGTAEDLRRFLEDEADFSDAVYRYKDWNLHTSSVGGWENDYLNAGLGGDLLRACRQRGD